MKTINWNKSLGGSLFLLHETFIFPGKRVLALFATQKYKIKRGTNSLCQTVSVSYSGHLLIYQTGQSSLGETVHQCFRPAHSLFAAVCAGLLCLLQPLLTSQCSWSSLFMCLRIAYSRKSICNSKNNTHSTFWVIQEYVLCNKKCASADVHVHAEAKGYSGFLQLS